MSMVVTMQWVASKHLALAVTVLPLLIGTFLFIQAPAISREPVPAQTTFCFEKSSATIRVTTSPDCPADLLSLGSGALTESATAIGEAEVVHPLLLNRFEAAKISAERAGVNLYITSGFRSRQRQGELYAEAIARYGSESEAAKWVLPPQFSHHPQGLALDINYPGDRPGAKWLERNGARFGLCRVYANEWWHFEAVSAPGQFCPAMAPNALIDLDSDRGEGEDLG